MYTYIYYVQEDSFSFWNDIALWNQAQLCFYTMCIYSYRIEINMMYTYVLYLQEDIFFPFGTTSRVEIKRNFAFVEYHKLEDAGTPHAQSMCNDMCILYMCLLYVYSI